MDKIDFSKDALTSEEEIRTITGYPHEHVIKKEIAKLDKHCEAFIAQSPLYFLSTSHAKGTCDVSPRGDQPNNVIVLNEHQLVLPERPGNRRADSLLNILSNQHVGLVFLIPGLHEVLRINGKATIIKNDDILEKMSLDGKAPLLGIGVDVEECFIHCARALKRSGIWDQATWDDKDELPSSMDIFRAHLEINGVKLQR
ncbi:MSMEG_1061 family FMN-dependent PPOX-type flavoprotein [Alteribacillus iranensis]|uniref:Pyridoxamine 5'-phosphate oxidase N-terminal domain-containing protein n=1 Tax=Alteribacillus iranensis TaxID=930128 RepID=A0A1I2F4V3_9BACI|nr:MSMEG_1061 family FMN-dependent PPOX-type flavoprotein [Alteribacillus iranensis]SFE99581.1 hypothetical protein SAMN05192532_10878 [Alteribacillus iranensis]